MTGLEAINPVGNECSLSGTGCPGDFLGNLFGSLVGGLDSGVHLLLNALISDGGVLLVSASIAGAALMGVALVLELFERFQLRGKDAAGDAEHPRKRRSGS